MNPCYIVNDYAQVQGDIPLFTKEKRAPRHHINVTMSSAHSANTWITDRKRLKKELIETKIVFGTLSNSQKMDPEIFHVWMNILQKFSDSKLLIMEYAGSQTYMPNLYQVASMYGIHKDRILLVGQSPWIDHLYTKTAIDMILDTRVKNGHTTGLDGIWAGVPTISFAGSNSIIIMLIVSARITSDFSL